MPVTGVQTCALPISARQAAGLTDGLLRLSVGIEACEDLQADLAAALQRAGSSREASTRAALSR
jgi:cystathionine gamma-synthase